ncbi:leucine-rich repeats and immunoglobulin-like domains protein 2 isoform X2 [Erythrolamprus reginae]|uniref:leucine-rich repeats and immunoglobulin-like domains protein 2 isoform X2 n=1 Tax=Erythrolamprus reginae TaxID=121349 RepID=UPI00396C7BE7
MRRGGEIGPGALRSLLPLLLVVLLREAAGEPCPPAAPCSCRRGVLDCSRLRLSGRSLEPGLLPPLPRSITALDLSHNNLLSSNWSIISSGQMLQEVKMNHNELSGIPHFGEATSNITVLSLVHNSIQEIVSEQLQPYFSLENLDLSSNFITEIKVSSFPYMQLKYLNLSNNRITILEAGCFDNLSNSLIVLKLNRNKISMIPLKTLKLPYVQFLELKRNRIKVIESLTFQGLDSLKSLKMQRNGINNLMDGAFFGLNNMEELELEQNNLTEVNKGWLYGLKALQKLYISQNAINRIGPDAWEFCQSLSELDLRNNEISWAIEDANEEAFIGLERLNKLILQGNQIKSITKKALSDLQALEYLDLTNNAIVSIEEGGFSQPLLKELLLNTSSLLCDCQLKWLPHWLFHSRLQDTVNVVCAHPEWLAGRSILSLNTEDFICDDFPKPQIRTHPDTTVALRGANVTLTCKAVSSSDLPISAAWRKDSEILYDADIENYVRYQQQDGEILEYTSILHVFNVNFTDEGKYQCIIFNHFGSNYSNKATLTVNELPSFMKIPMDLTVRTRAMAKLECAAEGHPIPQISWQKDGGTDFPAARERRMHVMPEDDVFFIVNVKIEDMGIYSCMAQNVAGSISANVTLTVLETPSFVRPLEDRTVAQGETAVLQCIASGSPAPRLNWTKDDGSLTVTERHFFAAANQLLIIVDAGLEDAGKYTCIMSNTLGTVRGHIYLYVLSSPNCDSSQSGIGIGDDGWTTVGIVIIVVVCCVVGTSLIWVFVIYHMRRKSEDYSITNTEEVNLPPDIPSYLSSQGTLSEPQEGYSNSEAGSNQQLMPPSNSYLHKDTDGGTEPLVICSDCYDNANIYSRNREYCPYTYNTEDDPLDQSLSSLMVQMSKEPYPGCPQHETTTINSLSDGQDRPVFVSNQDRLHNRKPCSQSCGNDLFQQSLWGISNDLGLLHPHCSSPSKTHEGPEVLRNEGISEKEPEQMIPPRLHHRLHQYNFDFNRTQDMQEHHEAT